jgi:uncharacterized membrane protein
MQRVRPNQEQAHQTGEEFMAFLEWLQATAPAVFIHQKAWAFTTVAVIHVFAVSLVIGTIAMVDLRLLGFTSARRPFTELARAILPWTWAAFALAVIAGSLLFASRATEYITNTTFWIKMGIMALAGINMLVFELITMRGVKTWDAATTPPTQARLAGAISIGCWALVVVFGRWTGFTMLPE